MSFLYRCPVCARSCTKEATEDATKCKGCNGLTAIDRFWTKVDKHGPIIRKDLGNCWIWTGGKFNHGYGQSYINGERLVHRIAYKLSVSDQIDGLDIDHRCRNIICCRPSHLRAIAHKKNCQNKTALSKVTASGFRGVYPRGNRWAGYVRHDGKHIYVGLYKTPEEAAEALRIKRIEIFTHNDEDRLENA